MRNENRLHLLEIVDMATEDAALLSGLGDALLLATRHSLTENAARAFELILKREAERIQDMVGEVMGIIMEEHER